LYSYRLEVAVCVALVSLRLPWAIFCRAFSPFSLSLLTSAATTSVCFRSSHAAGPRLFTQNALYRRGPRRTNGERAFAQVVAQGELFSNGPGGEALAEPAFALQNFGNIESHGVSPRNRFIERAA